MKTIVVHTPAELKNKHPEVFEKAHNKFAEDQNEWIPWADETIESMKAVIKSAGLNTSNYSISPDSGWLRVKDFDGKDLTGQRAIAWLENNLYNDLRTPWGLKNIKDRVRYHHPAGSIPECPLTGYCADDDMLGALHNEIMDGSTLEEAFNRLGGVCAKILEGELEYIQSEESFLENINDYMYTREGVLVN